MDDLFNEIPDDNADILIRNWEQTEEAKLLDEKEKMIWRKAFTWALDQGVAALLVNDYAEVNIADDWEIKFTTKLFDKFNTREISSVD